MSKRKLWEPKAFVRPDKWHAEAPSKAVERWASVPLASAGDASTIEIFGPIGADPFLDGFSLNDMSAALRQVGHGPVSVAINSPGGDFFDGVSIYNMLRQHPGEVNVSILGIAASAASIVAMAGDTITMGVGSTLMIHNSWGMVVGNQADMREAADLFALFDADMAEIYAMRTGKTAEEVAKLMAAETFMSAQEAVDLGFADDISNEKQVKISAETGKKASIKRKLEAILAKEGIPRSERRSIFRELTGTQDAADDLTPDAEAFPVAALTELLETLKV